MKRRTRRGALLPILPHPRRYLKSVASFSLRRTKGDAVAAGSGSGMESDVGHKLTLKENLLSDEVRCESEYRSVPLERG